MSEKKYYQICAKGKCLLDLIPEHEFEKTWKTMYNMVGLMKTDYSVTDLSFHEVLIDQPD